MKTMLVYTEEFISEEINEETGEVITPCHTEKKITPFDLADIVKVCMNYGCHLQIMLVDGTILEINNVEEIYYR